MLILIWLVLKMKNFTIPISYCHAFSTVLCIFVIIIKCERAKSSLRASVDDSMWKQMRYSYMNYQYKAYLNISAFASERLVQGLFEYGW